MLLLKVTYSAKAGYLFSLDGMRLYVVNHLEY